MTISAPMAETLGRINEIKARFEPPAPTASNATDFSSVLESTLGSSDASGPLGLLGGTDGSSVDLTSIGLSAGTSAASLLSPAARAALLQAGSAAAGAGRGVTGADVVADAQQYLGVPYKWGGTDPSKGLDCSGFVQRAYADLGIDLPRVSGEQAQAGTEVPSLADARPGDLVAFGQPVDHIAIYIGGGKIIQAPHTGDVVKISDISRKITTIRRIIPDTNVTATPAALRSTTPWSSDAPNLAEFSGQARYQSLFDAAGAKYGVDPALLASVAHAESNFDPAATSPAGAVGLMQFMPSTAASLGIDPTDPAQAIDGAARYLSTQIKAFGSVDLAVAAYNAGPGAVRRYGGIPPFNETRNYVAKVTAGIAPATAAAGRIS